jgi:hypothetical protein
VATHPDAYRTASYAAVMSTARSPPPRKQSRATPKRSLFLQVPPFTGALPGPDTCERSTGSRSRRATARARGLGVHQLFRRAKLSQVTCPGRGASAHRDQVRIGQPVFLRPRPATRIRATHFALPPLRLLCLSARRRITGLVGCRKVRATKGSRAPLEREPPRRPQPQEPRSAPPRPSCDAPRDDGAPFCDAAPRS